MNRRLMFLSGAIGFCVACSGVSDWHNTLDEEPGVEMVGSYEDATEDPPVAALKDNRIIRGWLNDNDKYLLVNGYRSYFDLYSFDFRDNQICQIELKSKTYGLWASDEAAIFVPALIVVSPSRRVLTSEPDSVSWTESFWKGYYFTAMWTDTLAESGQYYLIVAADNCERDKVLEEWSGYSESVVIHTENYQYYSTPKRPGKLMLSPRGPYSVRLNKIDF